MSSKREREDYASRVLGLLKSCKGTWILPVHQFHDWSQAGYQWRILTDMQQRQFVQDQNGNTSLFLALNFLFEDGDEGFYDSEPYSDVEQESPREFTATCCATGNEIDETVVRIVAHGNLEQHLTNVREYFCGDEVDQEHLESCASCTFIFSEKHMEEVFQRWDSLWHDIGRANTSLRYLSKPWDPAETSRYHKVRQEFLQFNKTTIEGNQKWVAY